MYSLTMLRYEIDSLRYELETLILKNEENLQDLNIQTTSKKLDELISLYHYFKK